VELVPGGNKILVTNENREEYLTALAQYRLGTRVQKEIEAFLKGLMEIIPEGLLSNFDENELEVPNQPVNIFLNKNCFIL